MASDVAALERLEDRAIAVDPAAIEVEFERMWRDAAGPGADASSVRLRVLNFVGVAADDSGRERFERLMMLLPQRHPCRGILALTDPGRQQVEATISAHCLRAVSESKHLCSEVVQLTCGTGEARALASLVRPLLVPEVPVVAWLIGEVEFDGPAAVAVMDSADQVFIDSAVGNDPAATLRAALDAAEEHDLTMVDLAWGRLITWRALVAQFFDSAEGQRQLGDIQSIEIDSARGSASSEVILLAGWFVSRLGLAVADIELSAGRLRATLYQGSRGVALSVAPGAAGEMIAEVRIRTTGALLTLQHHHESAHMHVIEEWPDGPVRRAVERLGDDDESVIVRSLDDVSDAEVFAGSVHSALALISPG